MAIKAKNRDAKYRVSFTVRNDAALHVDTLLQTGLYGRTRSKTAEALFADGLRLKLTETKGKYVVVFELYGYPAYVVDHLVGVRGNTREQVLEQMVNEWISQHTGFLVGGGLTLRDAEKKGYLQRRNRGYVVQPKKKR